MRSRKPIGLSLGLLLLVVTAAEAQRIPKPGGFNIFSKKQDVQLGKEAAAEIEKKVNLLDNKELHAYVEGIGRKLMQAPESGDYPYTFKVVHDDAINAFALPGGPTYVNTGLIAAAENEAQLAGVMSHEISHVALRHGTKQVSKANILSIGAMLGGGLIGGKSMLGNLA
ncbi:MAG: M48 family metalloprotease, partial [bacterium]|nr:M48 family metalloprotease [bacterium]